MYEILPYNSDLEKRYDKFIAEESINGTFLQSRRFLNYHPEGRFQDASFIMERSGTIAAIFPGCVTKDGEFVSHQGSTFGGPIFSKNFYSADRVIEILKQADEYLTGKYKHVRLKVTPSLFAKESPDLIEYALTRLGYTKNLELSGYSELSKDKDPLEKCNKECRRIFRKSEGFSLEYRDFKNDQELATFYAHLEASKAKHNVKPVHSLEELKDLRDNRISKEIRFRSLWLDNTYVAGMMLFAFPETKVLHAQYIAPNEEFTQFQPTTALYGNILREAAKEGFEKFSWGISTEDGGKILNESLFKFKESFGAKAAINAFYTK